MPAPKKHHTHAAPAARAVAAVEADAAPPVVRDFDPTLALDGSVIPYLGAVTAMALAWLGDRLPASVSYRDGVLTVVSHPDAQKRRFWEGM